MCNTADDRNPGVQATQEDGHHGRLRPLRQDQAPRLQGLTKIHKSLIANLLCLATFCQLIPMLNLLAGQANRQKEEDNGEDC